MTQTSQPTLAGEQELRAIENTGVFYGWVMLPLVAVLQVATSPGQTFGISVFNPQIRESLGLSHSGITGSYLLASALAAAPLPLVGWLIDRIGLKRTALIVITCLGFACVAISQAAGLITLTLSFLMLRAFGQGSLSLVANTTLPMWFHRRLGLVSGISGLGISAAVAVIPVLYLVLIQQLGWRNAYLALAVSNWLLLVPLVWLVFRNRPEDMGQQIDGDRTASEHDDAAPSSETIVHDSASFSLRDACRTRAYWIGLAVSMMWAMIGTAIFFNIIPLFESRGLTAGQATATFTTFAFAMAAMQLIGGYLADRFRLNLLLAASAFGLMTGVLTVWMTSAVWHAHLYAVQFGASQGLLVAVGNTLWPRYFGRRNLGTIRSTIWTGTVAGCSGGPFIMAYSFDYLGGYEPSLALFTGLLACGTVTALFATQPAANR